MSAQEKDTKKTTAKEVAKKAPVKTASSTTKKSAVKKETVKKTVKKETPKAPVKTVAKSVVKEDSKNAPEKTKKTNPFQGEKFYQGVGRRKTSTCVVRLYEKKGGGFTVNEKPLADYFPTHDLQTKVLAPLVALDFTSKFSVSAKVSGGGRKSQADAVRHGVGRAIVVFDENLRKQVKAAGFLTRDPRMRERKKPGLKRARRAPQWRKR